MAAILVSAKVSVFYSKMKKTSPKSSQQFYLAQTLIKHKKYNQNIGWLNYLLLNRNKKQVINKIGLPPNKRYRLMPLARHKSEDRSRYCHDNGKINRESSSHNPYVQQQASFVASKNNQKG